MLSRLFSKYFIKIKITNCVEILKILQSAKNQTGSIFFYLNIAQIMYFYIIFVLNHLKIKKIKDRRLC